MTQIITAKYGVALTIPFALHALDGQSLNKAAVHAAGDTVVMKDEAAEANTTNGFVDRGSGYSLQLTAAEMTCARALLMIEDLSGPKVWLSRSFLVRTFGNASAEIPYDFSQVTPGVDIASVNGSSAAAGKLRLSSLGVASGTVTNAIALTATKFSTDLVGADRFYERTKIVFVSPAGVALQRGYVTRYEATNGVLYVDGLVSAPSNTDPFILV